MSLLVITNRYILHNVNIIIAHVYRAPQRLVSHNITSGIIAAYRKIVFGYLSENGLAQ